MRKTLPVLFLAILLAGLAVGPALAQETEEAGPYKVGDMVSDLTVVNAAGDKVSIEKEGANDTKIIVFMNTACSVCRTELSHLKTILAGNSSVDLLVVATDFGPFERVAGYQAKMKYPGTWYQDEEFLTPGKFGFQYTPATVVLKGGKVVYSAGGYNKRKAAKFEQDIRAVIK